MRTSSCPLSRTVQVMGEREHASSQARGPIAYGACLFQQAHKAPTHDILLHPISRRQLLRKAGCGSLTPVAQPPIKNGVVVGGGEDQRAVLGVVRDRAARPLVKPLVQDDGGACSTACPHSSECSRFIQTRPQPSMEHARRFWRSQPGRLHQQRGGAGSVAHSAAGCLHCCR